MLRRHTFKIILQGLINLKELHTKSKLVKKVAKQTGIPVSISKQVIDGCFRAITEILEDNEDIVIHGFGKFFTKKHKPKKVKDFARDESFILPERYMPRFKFSKNIKVKE